MLRLGRNLLFYVLLVVSFIVGTTITLLISLFVQPSHKPFLVAARWWARFVALFSGIKVNVTGLGNIPHRQPVIFAANHQGAADILIVLANIPVNFRFAIKKELFNIPFFGWYLKRAGYFSIDRELVFSVSKTAAAMLEALTAGESVLVFPEGTRSRDGILGKFKRGSFMAALKSGAPIVPVAISGSYAILPKGSKLFKAAKVKLSFAKPVYIKNEEEFDRKVELVREEIAKLL